VRPHVSGPGIICLRDGDEIPFGTGKTEQLSSGPSPTLSNLQYAVARVLRMSGGADAIEQLKDDADNSDLQHRWTLIAKLLLSSGQLVF
jgi:hypothetical protein